MGQIFQLSPSKMTAVSASGPQPVQPTGPVNSQHPSSTDTSPAEVASPDEGEDPRSQNRQARSREFPPSHARGLVQPTKKPSAFVARPTQSSDTVGSVCSMVDYNEDGSAVGVKVFTGGLEVGKHNEVILGMGEMKFKSADGSEAGGHVLKARAELGVSSREDRVRVGAGAEADAIRVQGTLTDDVNSVTVGVGIGIGASAAIELRDADQDGAPEICAEVGGGILARFNVGFCVELPKPTRPSTVTGFNLRASK